MTPRRALRLAWLPLAIQIQGCIGDAVGVSAPLFWIGKATRAETDLEPDGTALSAHVYAEEMIFDWQVAVTRYPFRDRDSDRRAWLLVVDAMIGDVSGGIRESPSVEGLYRGPSYVFGVSVFHTDIEGQGDTFGLGAVARMDYRFEYRRVQPFVHAAAHGWICGDEDGAGVAGALSSGLGLYVSF